MKTVGATLIVLGLLVSLLGYGLYDSVICHCPAQMAGHAIGCSCGNILQQGVGHAMVYLGLAVAASGMVVFTHGWRKKLVFN